MTQTSLDSPTTVAPTPHGGSPDLDLRTLQEHLLGLSAEERLGWGANSFAERFALTTSFGIQSAVLLHMVSELELAVPVLWVDTGYLPPETYRYAETLRQQFGFHLEIAQSSISPARMEALYGKLWATGRVEDLESYHRMRKVDPLDALLQAKGIQCWASGVRGDQTDHRRNMNPLDQVRGLWSLRPLLEWSRRDLYYYMERHGLPQHPLFEKGYSTVGDWHSSGPDDGSASGRDTRFGGLKQECGIHLPGVMGEGI